MKRNLFFLFILFFILPINVFASVNCCAHHEGISHCGVDNIYICNDGTRSDNCACVGDDVYIEKTTTVSKKKERIATTTTTSNINIQPTTSAVTVEDTFSLYINGKKQKISNDIYYRTYKSKVSVEFETRNGTTVTQSQPLSKLDIGDNITGIFVKTKTGDEIFIKLNVYYDQNTPTFYLIFYIVIALLGIFGVIVYKTYQMSKIRITDTHLNIKFNDEQDDNEEEDF